LSDRLYAICYILDAKKLKVLHGRLNIFQNTLKINQIFFFYHRHADNAINEKTLNVTAETAMALFNN